MNNIGDLDMNFDELLDVYELADVPYVGKCKLVLEGRRQRQGVLNLKNHKWCVYSIESEEEFPFLYTHLILIPQKVTENIRDKVKNRVIKNGVGVAKYAPFPHIDGKTGNIHSDDYNVDTLDKEEVCQLVCCYDGHSGPSIKNHYDKPLDSEGCYYRYRENYNCKGEKNEEISDGKVFFVPKAAYYPLYDENIKVINNVSFEGENEKLYKIMESIWQQLHAFHDNEE